MYKGVTSDVKEYIDAYSIEALASPEDSHKVRQVVVDPLSTCKIGHDLTVNQYLSISIVKIDFLCVHRISLYALFTTISHIHGSSKRCRTHAREAGHGARLSRCPRQLWRDFLVAKVHVKQRSGLPLSSL